MPHGAVIDSDTPVDVKNEIQHRTTGYALNASALSVIDVAGGRCRASPQRTIDLYETILGIVVVGVRSIVGQVPRRVVQIPRELIFNRRG